MKTHCIVTLKLSYVTAHFPATAPSSLTVSIIANRKKGIKRERKTFGEQENSTQLAPVFLRATVTPHHVTSLITIFKILILYIFYKEININATKEALRAYKRRVPVLLVELHCLSLSFLL